jgi:hypothetical protein
MASAPNKQGGGGAFAADLPATPLSVPGLNFSVKILTESAKDLKRLVFISVVNRTGPG